MHRSLCVYSFDHRGTPERPGLVLGLDFGGACRGIAYRVAAKHRAATLAYLRGREQTTAVYRELVRGIWLEGQPDRRVEALCYAVDRGHPQYAGRLTHDRQLHIVRQGHGRSGNNRDYVIETVKALEALNITRSRSACAGGAPERLAGRPRLRRPRRTFFSSARNDKLLFLVGGSGGVSGSENASAEYVVAPSLSTSVRRQRRFR